MNHPVGTFWRLVETLISIHHLNTHNGRVSSTKVPIIIVNNRMMVSSTSLVWCIDIKVYITGWLDGIDVVPWLSKLQSSIGSEFKIFIKLNTAEIVIIQLQYSEGFIEFIVDNTIRLWCFICTIKRMSL